MKIVGFIILVIILFTLMGLLVYSVINDIKQENELMKFYKEQIRRIDNEE